MRREILLARVERLQEDRMGRGRRASTQLFKRTPGYGASDLHTAVKNRRLTGKTNPTNDERYIALQNDRILNTKPDVTRAELRTSVSKHTKKKVAAIKQAWRGKTIREQIIDAILEVSMDNSGGKGPVVATGNMASKGSVLGGGFGSKGGATTRFGGGKGSGTTISNANVGSGNRADYGGSGKKLGGGNMNRLASGGFNNTPAWTGAGGTETFNAGKGGKMTKATSPGRHTVVGGGSKTSTTKPDAAATTATKTRSPAAAGGRGGPPPVGGGSKTHHNSRDLNPGNISQAQRQRGANIMHNQQSRNSGGGNQQRQRAFQAGVGGGMYGGGGMGHRGGSRGGSRFNIAGSVSGGTGRTRGRVSASYGSSRQGY